MGKRKDNMLEAFQESARRAEEVRRRALEEEAEASLGKAEPESGAGGPFDASEAPARPPVSPPPAAATPAAATPAKETKASSVRADESFPRDSLDEPIPGDPAEFVLPMGWKFFVGLQVLLLALTFMVGRLSVTDVRAGTGPDSGGATPTGSPGEGQPVPFGEPPTGSTGMEPTAADRAVLDPRNKYMIRVLAYDNSERSKLLAFQAYDHLVENGFEAVWPRPSSDQIYVFVGAFRTRDELRPTLDRLRNTPGPGRDARAYASSYEVNIDDYIDR